MNVHNNTQKNESGLATVLRMALAFFGSLLISIVTMVTTVLFTDELLVAMAFGAAAYLAAILTSYGLFFSPNRRK